jgi:acyl carrier protein
MTFSPPARPGTRVTHSPDDVLRTIQACIVKVDPDLGAIPLTLETNFTYLAVPSIVMITIVFEIEETFDIVIVDAGLDNFETIGELRDLVLALLARKDAA